jgi:hypothetical protein
MDDAELQRELTNALSVAPSPDFVARVRMKVAQPETSSIPIGWFTPAAVAASLAAIAVALALRPGSIEPARGTDFLGSRPIWAVVQAPVLPSAPALASMRVSGGSIRESNRVPDVLIAQDSRQGLMQLLDGLRERRFEATFDQTPPSTPWVMSELTVTPLTTEPLAPTAANN